MKERKSLRMMLLGLAGTPGRSFESWRMEEEEQAQEEGEDKFSFQHVDLKVCSRGRQSGDVPYKRLVFRRKIRISRRFVRNGCSLGSG